MSVKKDTTTLISLLFFFSMLIGAAATNSSSSTLDSLASNDPYQKKLFNFQSIIPNQLSTLRLIYKTFRNRSNIGEETLKAQISQLESGLSTCTLLLQNVKKEVDPPSCSIFKELADDLEKKNKKLEQNNSRLSIQVAQLQSNEPILQKNNEELLKRIYELEQNGSQQCENCKQSPGSQETIQQLESDLTICNSNKDTLENQLIQCDKRLQNQESQLLSIELQGWREDLRRQFSIIVREVNESLQTNNISKLDFTEIQNTLHYIENLPDQRELTTFKQASEKYRAAMRDLSSQLVELVRQAASTHSQELTEVKKSRKEVLKKFEEVLQKLRECNEMLPSLRS